MDWFLVMNCFRDLDTGALPIRRLPAADWYATSSSPPRSWSAPGVMTSPSSPTSSSSPNDASWTTIRFATCTCKIKQTFWMVFLFLCQVILNIVGCLITLMSTWEENRLLLLFHIIFLCFRSSQQLMQLLELSLMDSTYILRILYELNVLPLALQITNICGNVLVNNPWEIYFVIINPKK